MQTGKWRRERKARVRRVRDIIFHLREPFKEFLVHRPVFDLEGVALEQLRDLPAVVLFVGDDLLVRKRPVETRVCAECGAELAGLGVALVGEY